MRTDIPCLERVEVFPQAAHKEGRLLRNDPYLAPQVVEAEAAAVLSVDVDIASRQLGQAEQGLDESALAGAGAADNANLLLGSNVECHVLQNERPVSTVPAEEETSEEEVEEGDDEEEDKEVFKRGE